MSAMTECKDCDYYYNDNDESQCRRLPPTMVPNGTGFILAWPIVKADGTYCCGEGQETE